MTLDWQIIATILIVSASACYLAYRGWCVLTKKSNAGCGTCASCPSDSAPKAKQLVTIETPVELRRRD